MDKLKIVNEYHEKAIQGLCDMIKEYAQQATENTYPFEVVIMAFDKYTDCDVPTPITIDNIIVSDDNVIVCYDNGEGEDSLELFSYDEIYNILRKLCKRL